MYTMLTVNSAPRLRPGSGSTYPAEHTMGQLSIRPEAETEVVATIAGGRKGRSLAAAVDDTVSLSAGIVGLSAL